MLKLAAGDYELTVAPAIGGSIRSFTWRGEALMRTAQGSSVLDAACFPLVPFSNRIAHGRFEWMGREVQLKPNFPGTDHPHPLHGFGWISEWDIIEAECDYALLEHRYPGGDWPWPYIARQSIRLGKKGLVLELSLTNLGEGNMPAGLGFHPYFPRDEQTQLHALHTGEWLNDADGLPVELRERNEPIDWWEEQPVSERTVDTVYCGRSGDIRVSWPSRGIALSIACDPSLSCTSVFVPELADWFCVEPVSHATNAVNSTADNLGMVAIGPNESMICLVEMCASRARYPHASCRG